MSSGTRVRRTTAEKRRIVELTFQPGTSVAKVAQAEGVNSHQVFQWRRAYRSGELQLAGVPPRALLPVVVNDETASSRLQQVQPSTPEQEASSFVGNIHIEIPGRALITIERGAEMNVVRAILEGLRR